MGFFKKIKKMLGHEKEDEDNLQPQEESVVSPKIVENSEPAEILYNFKYLDNLIKNSAEEIVLTSDIILDDDEESLYIDGIEVNNYNDCGLLLYDIEKQKVESGGSGAACSALVTFSFILEKLKNKELKRVLIIATGALHSSTSVQQKNSIPAIAHAIALEVS